MSNREIIARLKALRKFAAKSLASQPPPAKPLPAEFNTRVTQSKIYNNDAQNIELIRKYRLRHFFNEWKHIINSKNASSSGPECELKLSIPQRPGIFSFAATSDQNYIPKQNHPRQPTTTPKPRQRTSARLIEQQTHFSASRSKLFYIVDESSLNKKVKRDSISKLQSSSNSNKQKSSNKFNSPKEFLASPSAQIIPLSTQTDTQLGKPTRQDIQKSNKLSSVKSNTQPNSKPPSVISELDAILNSENDHTQKLHLKEEDKFLDIEDDIPESGSSVGFEISFDESPQKSSIIIDSSDELNSFQDSPTKSLHQSPVKEDDEVLALDST